VAKSTRATSLQPLQRLFATRAAQRAFRRTQSQHLASSAKARAALRAASTLRQQPAVAATSTAHQPAHLSLRLAFCSALYSSQQQTVMVVAMRRCIAP